MRTRDSIHRKRSPFFAPERFTYEPERDRYICPAGQPLNLRRSKSSQSRLDLHRHTQTLWPLSAPTAVHQCGFPLLGRTSARTGSTPRPRVGQHAGVREGTTAEKESRGLVCRAQESDRTASLALTTNKIRSGAVLPFRHACAAGIEVEIHYEPRRFRLRVRGNGKGIAPEVLQEGRTGHYGLASMQERAKGVGGKMAVWSEVGSGTEIELTIPASIAYAKLSSHDSTSSKKPA